MYQDIDHEGQQTETTDAEVWSSICEFNDKKPLHANVLKYWHDKRYSDPILYKLAYIVLGVPASQVSVERCFSSLKFVLSDYRTRLGEKTLEQIMIVRLNEKCK